MSAHGRQHWIKLYVEMLDDAKVGLLPDAIKWRWVSALLLAGELNEGGFLPDVNDAAWRLHTNVETLQGDMRTLAGRGLVELREYTDGSERWFIPAFEKRQAAATSTERSQASRHRARQKGGRNDKDGSAQRNVANSLHNTEYRIQNTETEGRHADPPTAGAPEGEGSPEIALREYIRGRIGVEPRESSPKYESDWRQPIAQMLILADGDMERAKSLIDAALEEARKPKKEDGLPYKIVRPCGLLPFYTTQVDNLRAKSSAASADTLWQRAMDFAGGNGAGVDSRLVAAIRAIGFPVIRAARADDIPRLKQQLATEYQRAATA